MKTCIICGEEFVKRYCESRATFRKRKVCSNKCRAARHSLLMKGKPKSKEHCKNLRRSWKGRKMTKAWKKRMADARKRNRKAKNLGIWNPDWVGSKHKNKDGYIILATGSVKIPPILEHRYVMEKHLGRKLKRNEIVHHVNGNKTDNSIGNLQLMTRSEHARHHIHETLNK